MSYVVSSHNSSLTFQKELSLFSNNRIYSSQYFKKIHPLILTTPKTMQLRSVTNRHLVYTTLLVFLTFLAAACSSNEEQTSSSESDNGAQLIVQSHTAQAASLKSKENARIFSSISPTQAFQMLEKRKDLLFLDVRSLREREQVSIPGSNYIPIGSIFKGSITLPQDKAILLYCAVGGRSYAAAKILSARGQHEVYNLKGGIEAWAKDGLPVLSGVRN